MKIGILGFQGAIVEHERHVAAIGAEPVIVRYREQLPELDGIILPGGESTTMGKLLNRTGMMEPLRDAIAGGLPAWGTCAGMILLAKRLENDPARYLALMDITVRRNAYGRQIDSFSTSVEIPEVGTGQLPLVFIRAPYITETGAGVQVLCRLDGHVVAAREGNLLATSFHPELTESDAFHRYFAGMCAARWRTISTRLKAPAPRSTSRPAGRRRSSRRHAAAPASRSSERSLRTADIPSALASSTRRLKNWR